jgi:DNA-binding NtrC family response regulator
MAAPGALTAATFTVPQRILLVGGQNTPSHELATALVDDGYEVTHTDNDAQLLECLDAIQECKLRAPSAIVLATRLSEPAGEGLFQAIGRTGWRIPVVFAGGPGRYRGVVPPSQTLFGPVDTADMRAVVRAVCSSASLTNH